MLVDVAARHGGEVLHDVWREADFRRLLDPDDIERSCGRGVHGSRLVWDLLDALPIVQAGETNAQMRAEFDLIEALMRLGVPRPQSNVPLHLDDRWYFPDLYWPLLRAVIEVDGPIHERPRRSSEDRLRDRHMASTASRSGASAATTSTPTQRARPPRRAEWLTTLR